MACVSAVPGWDVVILIVLASLFTVVEAASGTTILIIGCSVGGALVIIVLLVICCLCCRNDDDGYDEKEYYNYVPQEKPRVPPGIWTTAGPTMYAGHPPPPKAPAPLPPGHLPPRPNQHGYPRPQQMQQHPHSRQQLPPAINGYPQQQGKYDRRKPLLQRTVRGVRTALKRIPAAVFQVRTRGAGKAVRPPVQRVPTYMPPKPREDVKEKSVDIAAETIKISSKQSTGSNDTPANVRKSATARAYCNDYSSGGSVVGSQSEMESKSESSGFGAKVYSNYTDYSQPTYDTADPLDETVARAYYAGDSDSIPQMSQSTGDLADNRTKKSLGRSQSSAADHSRYQMMSANNWKANVNMPAPTRPVARTHSELQKMPAAVRSKYMASSGYYNPSTSEGSSLPSTGLPGGRPRGGVFLNRTPSDAAVQRMSRELPEPYRTGSSGREASSKRRAPEAPGHAQQQPTSNNANALYAQPARQAKYDPPPHMPPTPEDTIRQVPDVARSSRLESETDVDNLPTHLTVQAVIEHDPSTVHSNRSPREDTAGIHDGESLYTDFSVVSGYQYTTKLFGFLDQYTNETCDDDSNESDSDVTLEFSGDSVMDAFKFLDEYGEPLDESDIDLTNG